MNNNAAVLDRGRVIAVKDNTLKRKSLHVLDLFCGAGGFSEGFRQAGFRIIAGIDYDSQALQTYENNFPEAVVIRKDLSKEIDFSSLELKAALNQRIDVIIGGPPCQGFSIAGKRIKDDPRNTLYRAYLSFIRRLNPSAVVLENVPTIRSLFGGVISKEIKEDFEELGYKTEIFTLNAADYGVPQNRRRTFFVGTNLREAFRIPAPKTALSPITTEMAISDLPVLEDTDGRESTEYCSKPLNKYQKEMRKNVSALCNHWAVVHKKQTIEIIKLVPDGGNYKDLPENLRNTRKVNIAWTRMNSKRPCFTIDAGHNHHFHYKANRVPTVRECARIQSFPDDFSFVGKKTSQFKQVGNAVPPLLAKEIAVSLRKAIE